MQIVIDIDNTDYELITEKMSSELSEEFIETIFKKIEDGTPLPKGHRELKDINALKQKLMIWDYKVNAIPNYAWKCIEDAPTIIEADKEG